MLESVKPLFRVVHFLFWMPQRKKRMEITDMDLHLSTLVLCSDVAGENTDAVVIKQQSKIY